MAKDFIKHDIENKKTLDFQTKQGGDVDPFGDVEAKKGSDLDVKGGNAQNAKDLCKVDTMGTGAAKKGTGKIKQGEHFKVGEVDPSGNDAGKGSYRNNVG